jgi:hypothetical protein
MSFFLFVQVAWDSSVLYMEYNFWMNINYVVLCRHIFIHIGSYVLQFVPLYICSFYGMYMCVLCILSCTQDTRQCVQHMHVSYSFLCILIWITIVCMYLYLSLSIKQLFHTIFLTNK